MLCLSYFVYVISVLLSDIFVKSLCFFMMSIYCLFLFLLHFCFYHHYRTFPYEPQYGHSHSIRYQSLQDLPPSFKTLKTFFSSSKPAQEVPHPPARARARPGSRDVPPSSGHRHGPRLIPAHLRQPLQQIIIACRSDSTAAVVGFSSTPPPRHGSSIRHRSHTR